MKKYVFTSILLFLFSIVAGFLLGTNLWFIKDHIPKAEAAIVVSLLNICITLLALVAMLVRMHHGNQKADSVSAGPHTVLSPRSNLGKADEIVSGTHHENKKVPKILF
ncbi:MAG: hypothetical protein ACOX0J_14645 [Thermoactinomyces vulgaris]